MAPKFTKIIPSLPVSSIPKAIDFYTKTLGFRLAGRDRDDHCWLQLASDESENKYEVPVNVYLRRMLQYQSLRWDRLAQSHTGRGFPDIPDDATFGKIYVRIDGTNDGELEALLGRFRGAGAEVRDEITTKPWFLKDFTIVGKLRRA
jgi:catechol 2,3-dioxygenase-like lactoylglutathione lyase family enzyme